jgi:S1-C subfamily serine protease
VTRASYSPLLIVVALYSSLGTSQSTKTLTLSRDSAVQISSPSHKSSGSGSLISDQYIATCLHVVASVAVDTNNTAQVAVYRDLKVTLASGEAIDGDVISIPKDQDQDPLYYDFAFIKLRHKPKQPFAVTKFAADNEQAQVGDDVAFSGYPLETPGVTTLRGMVSGFNASKDLIIVQAPINKGNSGGALLK